MTDAKKIRNIDVKEMYRSYIKVLHWNTASNECVRPKLTCIRTNGADNSQKSVKRRLFLPGTCNDSDNDDIDPFGLNEEIENTNNPRSVSSISTKQTDKISATILVETLLGSTEDVKNFQKYRRMASEHVGNKLILQQYETAKAKVGFKLLGVYNKMKLFPNDLTLLQQLKNMLEHWGISTRY
ncbi:uncharacterized protein [Mytilus edulis]|uniref:uncharacterized protein n=1 Tax=Mytilus edulis TaxID=6550 RepID=UPI0039EF3369